MGKIIATGAHSMKSTIKQLRAQADKLGIIVYTQGTQWICIAGGYSDPLHYSIKTERQAIEYCIARVQDSMRQIVCWAE